jgi:hypothetical protein
MEVDSFSLSLFLTGMLGMTGGSEGKLPVIESRLESLNIFAVSAGKQIRQ